MYKTLYVSDMYIEQMCSLALGSQSPWEIKEISFNTVNSKRVLD